LDVWHAADVDWAFMIGNVDKILMDTRPIRKKNRSIIRKKIVRLLEKTRPI
jgi:hypothetical protein